jgi:hypothetical protein
MTGDVPVAADYDGDHIADIAVFRPSDGTWYVLTSSSAFTAWQSFSWGMTGDVPLPGDYDGDGKTDPAVWRPSTGMWYVLQSSTGYSGSAYLAVQWGSQADGDVLVPGDYDGDGKTDLAVWRPSTGMWYALKSSDNYGWGTYLAVQWGMSGDIPVPGDYNGDGVFEMAAYRPGTGTWYVKDGATVAWGAAGDVPVVKFP